MKSAFLAHISVAVVVVMMSMVMARVLLLWLGAFCCHATSHANTSLIQTDTAPVHIIEEAFVDTNLIQCCHVYSSIMQFVIVTTANVPDNFCPTDCKNDHIIVKITKTLYPLLGDGPDHKTFALNTSQLMSSQILSNMLAWSVIGRLSAVEKFGNNHGDYLEFDTGTQSLKLRRTGCEFQKIMYSTLLGMTTVLLSFLVISGIMSNKRVNQRQNDTPTKNKTSDSDSTVLESMLSFGSKQADTTKSRRRLHQPSSTLTFEFPIHYQTLDP